MAKLSESFEKLKTQYKSACDLYMIGEEDDKYKNTEEFFSFFNVFMEQLAKAMPVEKKPSRAAAVAKQQAAAKAKGKPAAAAPAGGEHKKGGISDALSKLKMNTFKDDK